MLGEHIAPQSEVIGAIFFEDSPCLLRGSRACFSKSATHLGQWDYRVRGDYRAFFQGSSRFLSSKPHNIIQL